MMMPRPLFAAYALMLLSSLWYQPGVGISSAVNAGCKASARPSTVRSVNELRAHQILGRYICKSELLGFSFLAFTLRLVVAVPAIGLFSFGIMNYEICKMKWEIISGLILSSVNIESEEPAGAAPLQRLSIRCKVAQPQTNHAQTRRNHERN